MNSQVVFCIFEAIKVLISEFTICHPFLTTLNKSCAFRAAQVFAGKETYVALKMLNNRCILLFFNYKHFVMQV